MPKLLALLPCEKIILDNRQNASLIIVMQNTGIQTGAEPIPKNAVVPKEWGVYALWLAMPDEVGKQFRQGTQIVLPDGAEFSKAFLPFTMRAGLNQNIIHINGFPVGQTGTVTLNIWVETEEQQKLTEVYSYPLNVTHSVPSQVVQ